MLIVSKVSVGRNKNCGQNILDEKRKIVPDQMSYVSV